ncbi:unnamed protein product [Paramecium primaurelia]|uniref:Uncharacterized protein n=1 Tax=Paramecium primaurelia TaxID=5886 RepID=A0A8S1QSX8_PARPR|nr:unnamed protein product [Paramecium primaurelia]CAD8118649.1 unnamed protein product [Paramecium primaurelia]
MNDIYDLVDGNYLPLALFTDCDDRMINPIQEAFICLWKRELI